MLLDLWPRYSCLHYQVSPLTLVEFLAVQVDVQNKADIYQPALQQGVAVQLSSGQWDLRRKGG